jgi:DcuC family C4-dicarboxylate transporter
MSVLTLLAGLVVIIAAIVAILRKVDVRLALLLAALALGALSGKPMMIVRTFLSTFSNEQFLVPIGCAVGFGYVLRLTECDQHLVQILVRPLRRVRWLLVPGVVLVGFAVNCPVVSQVGTAVSIGAVLVPLLRAARVPAVTSGAALLLGCSLGGDLLNPGAPEWRTVAENLHISATECVARVLPLLLVQVGVATALFWALTLRAERADPKQATLATGAEEENSAFRINYLKAVVPLVPLILLLLTSKPLQLFPVPKEWLTDVNKPGDVDNYGSRLIGAAMLAGVAAAMIVSPRSISGTAQSFFEGAGYAMTHIISVIVVATCFGKGVENIGVKDLLGDILGRWPSLLWPTAGGLPLGFGMVCGSGMATTQALFNFFVEPARSQSIDPKLVGAVVAITASAGRTMSPVAAVVIMTSTMTGTDPLALVRRVALPLIVGSIVVVIVAALLVN